MIPGGAHTTREKIIKRMYASGYVMLAIYNTNSVSAGNSPIVCLFFLFTFNDLRVSYSSWYFIETLPGYSIVKIF